MSRGSSREEGSSLPLEGSQRGTASWAPASYLPPHSGIRPCPFHFCFTHNSSIFNTSALLLPGLGRGGLLPVHSAKFWLALEISCHGSFLQHDQGLLGSLSGPLSQTMRRCLPLPGSSLGTSPSPQSQPMLGLEGRSRSAE